MEDYEMENYGRSIWYFNCLDYNTYHFHLQDVALKKALVA